MLIKSSANILKKYNINLTNSQLDAVNHLNGPAMVLSCPGSGKTTIIVCRIANLLLNHGIDPSCILTVTFSRAAANDMKKRFTNIFNDLDTSAIHFSTIHSFANAITREFAKKSGRKYEIIEGNNASVSKISILKQIYFEINKEQISDDKLEDLSGSVSYVKNMMLTEEQFNSYSKDIQIMNFNQIYISYETIKRDENLLDFDDMLSKAVYALKNDSVLLAKYQNRFKYIQIDEGQDTSRLQHEFIRLIADKHKNIFMVCDDDQSIYGFRGAFPKFILGFEKVYHDARIFRMEENFRSTSNIIYCANEFIKENKDRFNKDMFTKHSEGVPVEILTPRDEYEQIDDIINNLKHNNSFKNTAILYRNNLSAVYLCDLLERRNIPFYLRDYRQSFFRHWLVCDVIAFLRLALDNTDIESFERIYFKMNSYITKKAIEHIKSLNDEGSVFKLLRNFSGLHAYQVMRLDNLQKMFKTLSMKSPIEAIHMIETEFNYKKYIEENAGNLGYSLEGLSNIFSVLKLIAENTRTLIDFLTRLDKLPDILEAAKNNRSRDTLTLSTIHSSKGLEFDNVYIIDLIDGQFPTGSSIEEFEDGNPHELEEERRIFYVGITRAKNILKLLAPLNKNGERTVISRFVGEMFGILNPQEEEINLSQDIFHAGVYIEHNVFGKGHIIKRDDNIIVVDFGNNNVKSLSLNLCIEKDILRVLKTK